MENILLAGRKVKMEVKKGLKWKAEKNEDIWNLHENLKYKKLTSYIKTWPGSYPHKMLQIFLIWSF